MSVSESPQIISIAEPVDESRPKSRRGFASMPPEQQREIAQKGGRSAQARGHAHKFTPEEARDAGRKGGRVVSADRAHMAQLGRKGGKSRGQRRALLAEAAVPADMSSASSSSL